MSVAAPAFWLPLLEIIWIDVLLSGDNAVVIALACRSLPGRQRTVGIILGSGAAVALRVVFTVFILELLSLPFVKIAGGVLLLWIGVRLVGAGSVKRRSARPTRCGPQSASSSWPTP